MKTALLLLCLGASSVFALEDTMPNRERAAERYLSLVDVKQMYREMVVATAMELPLSERREFVHDMEKMMNAAEMRKLIRSSIVKCMTTDEIMAVADFYSTPLGKSAMEKMAKCGTGESMKATLKMENKRR